MDERILLEIKGLIEKQRNAAYEEGYRYGRETERRNIAAMLSETPKPQSKKPARRARNRRTRSVELDATAHQVAGALHELEADEPNGVVPDAIGAQLNIDPRQARQALRKLTMAGRARRVARGRYLSCRETEMGAAAE